MIKPGKPDQEINTRVLKNSIPYLALNHLNKFLLIYSILEKCVLISNLYKYNAVKLLEMDLLLSNLEEDED